MDATKIDDQENGQNQTSQKQNGKAELSESKKNSIQKHNENELYTKDIDFLLDVPLQVSVEVGRAKMLIKDFLKMKEGGVIELDKMADEPLDLYVNSRLIARGEAVVVNEKFGLRLIDVVSTLERLEKLR
ncbi:MAG: flagellar motor switch protein FliN [Desulfobacterales bacterium]